MLDAQEQEIINAGRVAGKRPEEIEAAIKRYRTGFVPPEPSKTADIGQGIKKGLGANLKNVMDGAAELPSALLPNVAKIIPGVKEKVSGAVKAVKDRMQEAIGLADENLAADNPTQQAAKIGTEVATLATPFVTSKLARLVPELTAAAPAKVGGLVEKAKGLVSPKKSAVEAIAQIGQGKTKTNSAVARTLQAIDTKGVRTHEDLSKRIKDAVPEYSRLVDDELAKDTGVYALDDLAVMETTKGGQKVSTDFVSRALSDLSELYANTGDDLAKAEIDEIIAYARTNGLTRKEVNDISRAYGQEFGSKAFSKTGDPLTSVNAQAYETTRKGLKGVARAGIGGKEAQVADEILSSMYDTQKLVDKNVEAVARLRRRIQERGLIEKAGYYVSKIADIASGGMLRGFVGGMLPRGVGYKEMNALDIEEALRKNLDIVEEALAAGTDDELIRLLQKSAPAFRKATPTGSK